MLIYFIHILLCKLTLIVAVHFYHHENIVHFKINEKLDLNCKFYIHRNQAFNVEWWANEKPLSNSTMFRKIITQIKKKCTTEVQYQNKDYEKFDCYETHLRMNPFCESDIAKYKCIIYTNNRKEVDDYEVISIIPEKQDIRINAPRTVCLNSDFLIQCEFDDFKPDSTYVLFEKDNLLNESKFSPKPDKCKTGSSNFTISNQLSYVIQRNSFKRNKTVTFGCGFKRDSSYFSFEKPVFLNVSFIKCSNDTDPVNTIYTEHSNIIPIITIAILILIFIIIFLIYSYYKKQKQINSSNIRNIRNISIEMNAMNNARSGLLERNDVNNCNAGQINSLDKIEILNRIGYGEFGIVYLGKFIGQNNETTNPAQVAVKCLKETAPIDDYSSLINEINTMRNLASHRNVVSYYGCMQDKEGVKIVMEYAENGCLLDLLKKSRFDDALTDRDLCQFCLDIARGMEYLASINILHRDLAARNVLVATDNVMKISDFGLSRTAHSYYKQTSNTRIPVRWMAPESLVMRIYTVESDVWSFGIVMWEIFSLGEVPYSTITDVTSLPRLLSNTNPLFRNPCPARADDIVYSVMQQCWEDSPRQRPNFSQLCVRLNQLLIDL